MILTALMPAVTSIDINRATATELEFDNTVCSFDRIEKQKQGCVVVAIHLIYKIEYSLWVPDENDGEIMEFKMVTDSGLEKTFTDEVYSSYCQGDAEIALVQDYLNQFFEYEKDIAAQAYTLSLVDYDVNTKGFTKCWSDDEDYEPTDTHLDLITPHKGWIAEYEEFPDWKDDTTGEHLTLPKYDHEIYIPEMSLSGDITEEEYNELVEELMNGDGPGNGFGLPTILSSRRAGWIGKMSLLLLLFLAEFCLFLSRATTIVKEVALLAMEFSATLKQVIEMINNSKEGEPASQEDVELFFTLVITMCVTLSSLILKVTGFYNPIVIGAMALTGWAMVNYTMSYPWQAPITIGKEFLFCRSAVKQCKQGEEVLISCRNVTDLEIEGKPIRNAGTRFIEEFEVDAFWKKGDGLFFRNCQATVTGDMHPDQELKTIRCMSYAAGDGFLNFVFGFDRKSRERNLPSIFENLMARFPRLARLLDILNMQPMGC